MKYFPVDAGRYRFLLGVRSELVSERLLLLLVNSDPPLLCGLVLPTASRSALPRVFGCGLVSVRESPVAGPQSDSRTGQIVSELRNVCQP